MKRTLLAGKIHRAIVTRADLHYVGSLTIDTDLMAAAGIVEGERVQVVDVDNGARLETYAIAGEPGTGVIGVNGAAAHRASRREPSPRGSRRRRAALTRHRGRA